ncbi:NHL repeat-containing protein [Streptomyces netropsis]|uniref:NHL repeat-containing protein n=1 Tax=Streptomyces netropsis TaxID=55404 RepID=UPI0030CC5405
MTRNGIAAPPAALSGSTITTVAGDGTAGFSGDDGPATAARLRCPFGVAPAADGSLYIADYQNHRVRVVGPDGVITTVAGDGTKAYGGDGGPARAAHLMDPAGVALDGRGNVYIADRSNQRVRRVGPDGVITTVAGDGTPGFGGDGGPATAASLNFPHAMAVDGAGNLYIADDYNHRVRKVGPDGIITTVAGNGADGFGGDGGPATDASLHFPHAVAFDGGGNLYIADRYNYRVRKVGPDGIITTVAGNGTIGFSGDGGPAVTAALNLPQCVVVDGIGNLYISDYGNERVRRVDTDGIITTVAGGGAKGYGGDGGPAPLAMLDQPLGIAVDVTGELYIADFGNHRVRKVSGGAVRAPRSQAG